MENISSDTGRPSPRPSILEIKPYVPGKDKATRGVKQYKLSSNESPLGSSERARSAYMNMAGQLQCYPDGSAASLRKAIGEAHSLNPNHLICGAGSDEILNLIAQAYLVPGDEAVYSEYGFLVYPIAIRSAGAVPVIAKEKNLTADVDSILKAVTTKTKVVFLANPNNPTGTYLPFEEVRRLHRGLSSDVLLVLDAAYAEYVQNNDYESGLALVSASENVIMTRTFSKIYGLASLRLGWAYAPPHVIDVLNRIRGPFNVTGSAIAAGVEAIKDLSFLKKCIDHNIKWLPWLIKAISDLGLVVTPSVGNFILIHFPDKEGRRAEDAEKFLSQHGCILRGVAGYGLPNALRMSIGSEEANRAVVEHLSTCMNE